MAAITPTNGAQVGAFAVTETTLTSSDTLTFAPAQKQLLVLRNDTGGSLTATIDGDAGTTVAVDGLGSVSVSAGLAIAERMNAQVRGMNVAARNANDGISLAQVAEGALSKIGDSLQRMRELAVQARNASNSQSDKDSLDKEFGELAKEIQRVIGGTTFNGKHIIGSDADTQTFQIGANTSSDDTIDLVTTNMGSAADLTAVAGTDNTGAARAVIDSTTDSTSLATVMSKPSSRGTPCAAPPRPSRHWPPHASIARPWSNWPACASRWMPSSPRCW